MAPKRGLLSGYLASLKQKDAKESYVEKIKDVTGHDPYEMPRNEWEDDVET